MRPWYFCPAMVCAAWLAATPADAKTPANPKKSDPQAISIAGDVMDALGGRLEWRAVRGLRWISGAELKGRPLEAPRRHSWDRWQQWHRMQGVQSDGRPYVIIENLLGRRGKAWLAGKPVEGDSLELLLAHARAAWKKDSFWLLMPYRLQEPGVILTSAGDTTVAGVAYDRIAMTFDLGAEHEGDRYWIYVNRSLHQIQACEALPAGTAPPARRYTFEGWKQAGHMMFPNAHRDTMFVETPPGDTLRTNIYSRAVQPLEAFPPHEFTAP